MEQALIKKVEDEEWRGKAKWRHADISPPMLLNAATEELGEVAHAINHNEGKENIQQEIAEVMGILSRLYEMVNQDSVGRSGVE